MSKFVTAEDFGPHFVLNAEQQKIEISPSILQELKDQVKALEARVKALESK